MTHLSALTAVMLALTFAAAQERPLPAFDVFAAEVKKHLQTDEERQAGYAFTERRTDRQFDREGRVKDETISVFEVLPGLPGEGRYLRLIEENGKPVPQAEIEKRDRERQRKAEQFAREQAAMTESDRWKQARESEKARKQRAEEIEDVFTVFDIRLVRREAVEGHATILFTLTPLPKVRARTALGGILQRFSMQAWVSESDYELVRVRAEAVQNVTFGILGRIDKGATFVYERHKVNGEIWLPSLTTYRGGGRVLLRGLSFGGTSEFSNYRKFTVETTTEIGTGAGK